MNVEEAGQMAVQAVVADLKYLLNGWRAHTIPVMKVHQWLHELEALQGLAPEMPSPESEAPTLPGV